MQHTIHIVDDDDPFRNALGRLLEAAGFRVMSYSSGDAILAHPPESDRGCILLDLSMPGVSGPELHQRLARQVPTLPIMFLTGYGDIRTGVDAIKAGAEDFLVKPVSSSDLLAAIDRAMLKCARRRSELERVNRLKALVESLTPREYQVFGLMVRGKRNKQIAHAIDTSERTVKAHRHSIMVKLGVNSLAEAVSIAEKLVLIDAGPDRPAAN